MKRLAIVALICAVSCGIAAATPQSPVGAKTRIEKKLYWQNFRRDKDTRFISEFAAIQYLLRARGEEIKIDGIFGAQTERAVRHFQKTRGLKVDGIAGGQTLQKLIMPVRRGSHGDAVRALQTLLHGADSIHGKAFYNTTKVDGVFGNETLKAVRDFRRSWMRQSRAATSETVGLKTWNALFNTKDFYGAG